MRYVRSTAAGLVSDWRISIRYELKPLRTVGAAVALVAVASAVGSSEFFYEQFAALARGLNRAAETSFAAPTAQGDRRLPAGTALTVLVASYPDSEASDALVRDLTAWLEASGHRVFYERVNLGGERRQWRVLAGAYTDREYETASWDAARLKAAAPALQARVVATASAWQSQ